MTKKSDSNKPKYFGFIVILSIALLITIFTILKISNYFTVTERMLFWFFAASSQSMAAMFAVVGVFAVFRFQAQENRLKNLYEIFKNWSMNYDFGIAIKDHPNTWKDNKISEFGRSWLDSILELVETKGKDSSDKTDMYFFVDPLRVNVEEIEYHEIIRNDILKSMKTPMVAILSSFMLSTVSLVMTVKISCSIAGFIILMVMIAMIAFSVISVYKYIMFSTSLGR